MTISRRKFVNAMLGLGTLGGLFGAASLAQAKERVIKIRASAFEYNPSEITLKKNEPVILELTSADLFHGFNCTEFKVRADLAPKKTVKLRVVPKNAGDFEFHCDNFCGSGHEGMSGLFKVVA
jgi:cytochrome c oxidase subunit 2